MQKEEEEEEEEEMSGHHARLCCVLCSGKLKSGMPTMRFSARAAGGGKTWSAARGCGVRGRSWGAFCGGVAVDARALACRSAHVN